MNTNKITKILIILIIGFIANSAYALEHQFIGTITDRYGLANSAKFRILTEGNKKYVRNVDVTMTMHCDDTTGNNIQQLRIKPYHTRDFIRLRKNKPIIVQSEQFDYYTNYLVKINTIKMTVTNSSVTVEVNQRGNNGEICTGAITVPVGKSRNLKSEGFIPFIGKDGIDVEMTLDGRLPSIVDVKGLAKCSSVNGVSEEVQIQLSSLYDSMKILKLHKNYFQVQLVSDGNVKEDIDARVATIEGRIVRVKGEKQIKIVAQLEDNGLGQNRCRSVHKEKLQKDF